MKHLIVGTAGHIDHGKSALVEALTGTNPDRLEEEKRRGITIDLGFAHLDLGPELRAGFVDVPGHERFVRNMLAGASGMDLVLLVVAADESIKPQTREHFDICRLLGVRKGLIAITKSDLVEPDILDLVTMEIQEFAAGSFLEGAPVVPVSARTGQGLEALKAELRRLGQEALAKPAELPFRLPVDRAFVMKGFGAVVTGTLVAGEIAKGEEVEIFPLGRRARVRGIEVHNQSAERAVAGQRTALNLAGVEARELERGMVLARPGLFEATDRLDAALALLGSARPLKTRTPVHFHSGTAEAVAEVVLLQGKELRPGEQTYAQLRLSRPGLFLPGDRFIIRQFSPVITIGGGEILDNLPARHHAADERRIEFFRASERGDAAARLETLMRELGEAAPSALVARTGLQPAEVLRVAAQLAAEKRLILLGEPASLIVHAEHFQALAAKVVEALEQFHAANPLVVGLAKEELRGRVASRAGGRRISPSVELFDAVLQSLAAQRKVETQGELVRLKGREVQLSAEEQNAKERIARAFEQAGLAVPGAGEVLASLSLDRRRADKILQILLKEKILVRVTEDLIFHHAALEGLRALLAHRKQQSPRINVAVFKELTGLSRKYAIPLLEYLDRERVTRREGDERVIL
jgi:selenocysteine-specific elongation factor